MALARVVSFDEVGEERIDKLRREIEEGERPEGIPATEIVEVAETVLVRPDPVAVAA